VVSYDFQGLVHLATLTRTTGRMFGLCPSYLIYATPQCFRLGQAWQTSRRSIAATRKAMWRSSRPRAYGSGQVATYVRLHRLMTGLSEKALWELLSTGQAWTPIS